MPDITSLHHSQRNSSSSPLFTQTMQNFNRFGSLILETILLFQCMPKILKCLASSRCFWLLLLFRFLTLPVWHALLYRHPELTAQICDSRFRKKQGEFSKSETELENYTYTLRLHFKAALKWYLSIICIVL